MERLSDEELNKRIESFITRKHHQYPELALRGKVVRTKSTVELITEKIYALNSTRPKQMKLA